MPPRFCTPKLQEQDYKDSLYTTVDGTEREWRKRREGDGKDEKGDARELERIENKVNGSWKTTRQQRATMLVPRRPGSK